MCRSAVVRTTPIPSSNLVHKITQKPYESFIVALLLWPHLTGRTVGRKREPSLFVQTEESEYRQAFGGWTFMLRLKKTFQTFWEVFVFAPKHIARSKNMKKMSVRHNCSQLLSCQTSVSSSLQSVIWYFLDSYLFVYCSRPTALLLRWRWLYSCIYYYWLGFWFSLLIPSFKNSLTF